MTEDSLQLAGIAITLMVCAVDEYLTLLARCFQHFFVQLHRSDLMVCCSSDGVAAAMVFSCRDRAGMVCRCGGAVACSSWVFSCRAMFRTMVMVVGETKEGHTHTHTHEDARSRHHPSVPCPTLARSSFNCSRYAIAFCPCNRHRQGIMLSSRIVVPQHIYTKHRCYIVFIYIQSTGSAVCCLWCR